jgi:hypothetical protein
MVTTVDSNKIEHTLSNITNENKVDLSTLSGNQLTEQFNEQPTDQTLLRSFFTQ